MLTTDPARFLAAWRSLPLEPWGAATAKAVVLMSPDGLSASAVTSADNRYMDAANVVDTIRVHEQHRALAKALANESPVCVMPGDQATPDATFLNNAFATVPGRLVLGAMRYPERQRETGRPDVRRFFVECMDYREIELTGPGVVAELTGSLIVDRRRGVGFCGLGERCNLAGAQAMHDAFGLRLTFAFDLSPAEYHTNVVMSVLAGRTLVICRDGLAGSAADAVAEAYGNECVDISTVEKNAFAGNCIALRDGSVWMSVRAECSLSRSARAGFDRLGWRINPVDLSEIEKAGGSLRCCVAEVF